MSGITLNAAETQTLASLQQVNTLFNNTQTQLNTGKKVNSAADNAIAYFQSQALYNRSSELSTYKANTDQSVQSLNAAIAATSAVGTLLNQLKGIADGAKGTSASQRVADTAQFQSVAKQLFQLVKDSTYQGLNLLSGTAAALSTQFSERTAATLKVSGYNLISSAAGNKNSLFTAGGVAFSSGGGFKLSALATAGLAGFSQLDTTGTAAAAAQTSFQKIDNALTAAINQNQAITASLGTNVTILQTRSNFTANYTSVLSAGGDKLTLADLNVEAANSQALTLRQQIGIQSLSVENSQNQGILNLLR